MTVSELIEKSKELPQDQRIVVAGYESRYNDISETALVSIELEVNTYWWEGAHDDAPKGKGIEAIALLGKNHLSNEAK